MPWVSAAQRRWGNSPAGHKALGDAGVSEWNAASKGSDPPERAAVKTHKVDLGSKGNFSVKKGALHEDLGIPLGEKIPKSTEEKAAHGSGVTARRARSALGFRAMNK